MCGILGILDFENKLYKLPVLSDLLFVSARRGSDATGVCALGSSIGERLVKLPVNARELWNTNEFKEKIGLVVPTSKVIIGQTRLATNGSPQISTNNQPIRVKNCYLVHNGIIVNSKELAKNYNLDENDSDSRVLTSVIAIESKKMGDVMGAIHKISGMIAGTINLIVVNKIGGEYVVNLVTNNGSLYWGEGNGFVLVASEKHFLDTVALKNNLSLKIYHLESGNGVEFCKNKLPKKYKLQNAVTSRERAVLQKPGENLLAHQLDQRIENIKRCRKCILPFNTPFISFDEKGVCNYCREHQKISYGSELKLKKLVKKYKNKMGKPNCILAFSGGRDSAYGLHYLVKELGMNPVAVTFDWGMVSDIGRRNQARLLSILGVEQIVVSADLDKVRNDIRKNLLAWLRKPDLGMVPLLMQADKVTEYYVDKIKKELGVDLVFFCRGNELEREEFKAGYCGIKNADPGGVIHNYAVVDKLKLLGYYVRQFLVNPYYLNSSLWSSLLGYLVTYVVPHDYIYLWHYVKWDEKKILKTLYDKYGWEDDGEVGMTWRIDDGSPAFYNYLYGQIQGFTENDSFRSRQIREGLLTRKAALKIVARENKPRYSALQWYFEKIGLNGSKVLSIIDSVKKRY
ncbi:MAG: hypothetical protein WC851_02570 [Candidatus Shapirobacteria bacterium]|jgi:hypothetical protein